MHAMSLSFLFFYAAPVSSFFAHSLSLSTHSLDSTESFITCIQTRNRISFCILYVSQHQRLAIAFKNVTTTPTLDSLKAVLYLRAAVR
ncbi:hypothetical protein B0H13DRAFT_1937808 [Mycena leptocephala]|nr:hypothetical protein B0H13DRAFT_1937808 [Mycena leptocephala]